MEFERELTVALEAVRSASRICRNVQDSIDSQVLDKADKSPVTVADFASQAVVCRFLSDAFPDDPIVAEEHSEFLREPGNRQFLESVCREVEREIPDATTEHICYWIDCGGASEATQRFWTLDPIDGTKGFLRREQFAISLALIVDGHVSLGVLGCPNLPLDEDGEGERGVVFYAVRDAGARQEPLDQFDASPVSVRVSGASNPASARLCESVESGHSSHHHSQQIAERLRISAAPVRMDSQAKYAAVARGEADIYLRLPTRKGYREKIWDHAGGVIVVQEAGGTVTDVRGRPLDFSCGSELRNNAGVIVTNGALHQQILDAVEAVLGDEVTEDV